MKKLQFKTVFVLLALAFILSGCGTTPDQQNSQQSAAPTISGYVNVGGAKTVH